ncbi:MAG: hypothetical protein AB9866_14635 [Syntrophobacteraceae bacterium]
MAQRKIFEKVLFAGRLHHTAESKEGKLYQKWFQVQGTPNFSFYYPARNEVDTLIEKSCSEGLYMDVLAALTKSYVDLG